MGAESFTGNPSYKLEVSASLKSQSVKGNYSIVYYRVRVVATGANGGYWTPKGTGNSGWADSSVGAVHDLWHDQSLNWDFRKGSAWDLKTGTFKVFHRKDGSAEYWVNAAVTLTTLGKASDGTGTIHLPKLSHVPPAPSPLGLDEITVASMRFRFQSNGNGDRPITGWEVGYMEGYHNPKFSVVPQHTVKSNGNTTVKNLIPGRAYTFWARGKNINGWGPWSVSTSAKTNIGAKVKLKGIWHDAIPYVKVAGKWRLAQPYVKVKGVWKPTE